MQSDVNNLHAGIFVGGAGSRLGGLAKGLLRLPSGETLVDRWRAIFDARGIPCSLVGVRPEYASVNLTVLEDSAPGLGPLGGLIALLAHVTSERVVLVGCDMPFVSAKLVNRLILVEPHARAVAPKRGGFWEPLFSRMDVAPARVAAERLRHARRKSLTEVLEALDVCELPLSAIEEARLRDIDTPEDLAALADLATRFH